MFRRALGFWFRCGNSRTRNATDWSLQSYFRGSKIPYNLVAVTKGLAEVELTEFFRKSCVMHELSVARCVRRFTPSASDIDISCFRSSFIR